MNQKIELTKDFYRAYATGDRKFVESNITDDFSFSAPPDPHLDRAGYFERCWPGAGKNQSFEFKRLLSVDNEVIVTYESKQADGAIGTNTEILTFKDNKVCKVEVYFGWTIDAFLRGLSKGKYMTKSDKLALNGFADDLFAGMQVSNYKISRDWYERLLGCPPSFLPNDVEAVWQIAEHRWLFIVVEPSHAGHSVQHILGADLDTLISQISERGIDYSKEELPAKNTRKVIYHDPDGNEIGFISVSSD